MLERFNTFIKAGKLFSGRHRILLAVSGGIDSMVMLDLFRKSRYPIGIAHCNFTLRGNESDIDQSFVRSYAEENNIPFFTVAFETEVYAGEKGLSIQMAARELRYNWLCRLSLEENYHYIATGHSIDDSIETFFINLSRGTGIHGLTGISDKQGVIVRPLLFATRKEIEEYAEKNNIRYREDSSNAETKYLRNKFRHKIIPLFEKVNPSFRQSMAATIAHLKATESVFNNVISQYRKSCVKVFQDQVSIDYTKLSGNEFSRIIIYELLNEYGFNSDQAERILNSAHTGSGKKFYSTGYRLVKDRTTFIITTRSQETNKTLVIDENTRSIQYPISLKLKKKAVDASFKISGDEKKACLDFDTLVFPLQLRKWRKGDKFMPLGMNTYKKLSDFFTDHKFSIPDKEKVWLLVSEDEIVWILGHRIDNRFKITQETQTGLIIEYRE